MTQFQNPVMKIRVPLQKISAKELERNNLRNEFLNSNEIMEQRMELFKYSVKIESSYFAAGTKDIIK
jgi:hypothetical protein